MTDIQNVKFVIRGRQGTLIKVPGVINITDTRIEFIDSPFALKDDIKAMKGSRWHGFEDPPRKIWTVENCPRNWFTLKILMGLNPYTWFDQPRQHFRYDRPLMSHQKELADCGLTYRAQILAAEMGAGKSLSAIEIMEQADTDNFWWVGPKSGLYAIEREFKKWEIDNSLNIEIMTYEGLTKKIQNWHPDIVIPQGIVFDESHRLKSPRSQRSQAAQYITDCMREKFGDKAYVILMTGTPAPHSPLDWWKQAELCYPGYLKEGTYEAFKARLSIMQEQQNSITGQTFLQRVTWKDNELKCDICGGLKDTRSPEDRVLEGSEGYCLEDGHQYKPSKNEVAYLYERLKGLAIIKQLHECVDLPDKLYRIIQCEPRAEILRVAKALVKAAPNTITGLTWLRELSDGFQYRNTKVGMQKCPVCNGTGEAAYWVDPKNPDRIFDMDDFLDEELTQNLKKTTLQCLTCNGSGEVEQYERTVKEVPCPKDAALLELLDENEDQGRVVIFAGFTGSIDKVTKLCLKEKWAVVRVDGRGWITLDPEGEQIQGNPLDYWADKDNQKVAFVAHPKSGGMGLTLTEARMAIYYSNSYESESRIQSEGRIHRIGMDMNRGATIVDLINLPTDEAVLQRLKDNRRLELMTMGEIEECFHS